MDELTEKRCYFYFWSISSIGVLFFRISDIHTTGILHDAIWILSLRSSARRLFPALADVGRQAFESLQVDLLKVSDFALILLGDLVLNVWIACTVIRWSILAHASIVLSRSKLRIGLTWLVRIIESVLSIRWVWSVIATTLIYAKD